MTIQHIEFLPKVFIYKGLLPRAKEIADHAEWFVDNEIESNRSWNKAFGWGNWGKAISFYNGNYDEVDYSESDLTELESIQRSYRQEILDAFYTSTSHYLSLQGVKKEDDWIIQYPSIAMYSPTMLEDSHYSNEEKTNSKRLAMAYHTDYEQLKEEMPGNKFILTCTLYLNDNYDGGEIDFLLNGESHSYKPSAGDVIVFPSGHPDYLSDDSRYFHGVGAISNGRKVFIRSFYQKPYAGSDDWLANEKKYGKDLWLEMEKARILSGLKSHKSVEDEVVIDCGLHDLVSKD
jgi:hypothetical protein